MRSNSIFINQIITHMLDEKEEFSDEAEESKESVCPDCGGTGEVVVDSDDGEGHTISGGDVVPCTNPDFHEFRSTEDMMDDDS